ncbi:hypothetical protein GJU43_15060 [Flavobacterium sp. LC2016-23]|uniref:hypothetical protein n=1 Tax=Flavobacterium sp. LC2016-23 TaxID=2666330 RepID=UPI0012AEF867|nr:hypothetical protein [Flavobacterium sp. LC2016-23]MRX40605.1 hypothetical protein [Flavobacterium sp. LC2016-23]
MGLSTFTYTGPEALEMIKNTFPKTWEKEIEEGDTFIKALMNMYHLSAEMAFEKYLRLNGSPAKGIATLAALHLLLETSKTSGEIKKIQKDQLEYGNQLAALENATHISYDDKKTLRSFYLTKQDELQKRINVLILKLPVRGTETITVQTGLFD